MNTRTSRRLSLSFQILSGVILIVLTAVQVIGADALFGSLIVRGFLPRELTFAGIAAPLLNMLHLAIYGGVGVSFAALAVYGPRAWWAGVYVAVPTALQVVYNGCVLTDLQNALWVAQGVQPIGNEFIFNAFVPLPPVITKSIVLALAGIYAAPAVIRASSWVRGRYGATVIVPRMPLETWPSTEQ